MGRGVGRAAGRRLAGAGRTERLGRRGRRELVAGPPAPVGGETDDAGPACLGEGVPLTTRLAGKGDEGRQQLEGGGADPANPPKRVEPAKWSKRVAVRDDAMGEGRTDPRQALNRPLGGRVEVDRATGRPDGAAGGRSSDDSPGRHRAADVDAWAWRRESSGIELMRTAATNGTGSATISHVSRHSPAFSALWDPIGRSDDRGAVGRIGLAREGLLLADGWRRAVEHPAPDDAYRAAQQHHHGHEGEGFPFGRRWHGAELGRRGRSRHHRSSVDIIKWVVGNAAWRRGPCSAPVRASCP
jgi:hypothetical protein